MLSNTSRPGKYGHRFVHNISKCISPMQLFNFASDLADISKKSLYQHPICGSKYWPGAEQASCHYMKQRWPFWRMHMSVIWPQWVNELSALLKTEYQWRGNIHGVVNWEQHDDVFKWKHFPRYWPFVRGIHRFPVNSPHKGQWRGALMFSLICVWTNGWVNNREAGDLDAIVPIMTSS